MEDVKGNSSTNVADAIWTLLNLVSHEVTVESQQGDVPISEKQIFADDSVPNLTQSQGSGGQNGGINCRMEEQNITTTNSDVPIVELGDKKMNYFMGLELASTSHQRITRNKISHDWSIEPVNDKKNILISEEKTTFKISPNFEGPPEYYTQNATPGDLVIPENKNQFAGNVLDNTDPACLDYDENNKNPNTPNTYGETPQSNVPPVILRSVQKLFTIRPTNTQSRYLYPLPENTYTPNVDYDQNYNVAVSLSQISLGNRSIRMVPFKPNASPDAPGTSGILPERGQTNTRDVPLMYPASNIASNNKDNIRSVPTPQFSQFGNYDRRIGLRNNGSTCYVNSVLQVLLATNKFSTFTVVKMHKYPYWSKLAELFATMMYTLYPAVNPSNFYMCLNSTYFNIFTEHDASEFLIFLFELLKSYEPNWEKDHSAAQKPRPSMSTEARDNAVAGCSYRASEATPRKRAKIEGFNKSRRSYIDNLFGGIVATMIRCQVCNIVSNKYEMVYMLNLSFPDVMIDEVLTVQSLLNYYFTTETLTGDNRYMCGSCLYRQDALKTSIVVHNPKYLILTLKNFRYDTEKKDISKQIRKAYCDHKVHLHSKTTQNERSIYELYAMIVHSGQFLDTGHYTALTKCNNQWFKINDKIVRTVDSSAINRFEVDETPYLLFYRRSDIAEESFPAYDKIPWFAQYVQEQQNMPREGYYNSV